MASPGEDNLQILGILSLEVRTPRLTFSCFRRECYELLGGRFQESSEEPRERTSKGRVGSVLALGTAWVPAREVTSCRTSYFRC